jgi:hypothetical protein
MIRLIKGLSGLSLSENLIPLLAQALQLVPTPLPNLLARNTVDTGLQ